MEPFKIICVTCQARLTVRNPAAIGQILGCPKCGSMVQVTAPAGAAGNSGAAASSAATAKAPAAAAAVVSTFDDITDMGIDLSIGGHLGPAPVPATAPAAGPASAKPNATAAAKQAGRLSAAKVAALVGGSALVGSVLVLAALSVLRGDRPPAAPAPSAPLPTDGAARGADSNAEPAEVAPIATAPSETETITTAPSDPAPADPFAPPADAGVADDPFAPPPAESTLSEASTPSAPTEPAPPASDQQADAAPRLQIDPLDFDPEGLDLASLMRARDSASTSVAELTPEAPPDAAASEAPAGDEAHAPAADGGPPVVEAAAPTAPPAVLLARRYPAVKVERMPLGQFLDLATALSAMPVSVAPDELRLAAVSAAAPVSVDAKDATIESVLTAALKPLRLVPTIDGDQIVLERKTADARRALAYPVDDLVDGDAAELARWVQDLVAPESWKSHGGDGELTADGETLRINQSERAGYQTILFLEQYRTARGLAPRSKYPADLLTAAAERADLEARLAGPATFTFLRPTAARDVFRWWQQELGASVLVDWPALAGAGLAPTARLTASAAAQPWGEALDAVLGPLGLGWRAVDRRTIEITTLEKVNAEPVVEIYRVAGEHPAGWFADEAAKLGAENAATTIIHDAAHNVLLVRQPARIQRELAKRLAAP